MKIIKKWTEKEDNFLKKNFKKKKYRELAIIMGRTHYSVKGRITQILDLHKQDAQKIFISKEELERIYNEHGKIIDSVAKKFNVSHATILNWLKKYGIERRVRKARYIDKICIGCNKEFTIKYKQRNRKFCSFECGVKNKDYKNSMVGKWRKDKNSKAYKRWRKVMMNRKRKNVIPLEKFKLTKDFSFCLGAYYGDGWSIKRLRNYNVFLASTDKDFIDYYKKCFLKWSGLKLHDYVRFYNYGKGRIFYASISCHELKHFVNFKLKKLYDAPNTVKAAFVKGIADGEGSIYRRKRGQGGSLTIHNTDLKLIKLCKRLMQDLEIESKYYIIKAEGFKGHYYGRDIFSYKKQYVLCLRRKENLIKFNNKIGFSIGRKQGKLDEVVKSYELRN